LLQAGVDVDLKAGLDTFESVYEDDKVLM